MPPSVSTTSGPPTSGWTSVTPSFTRLGPHPVNPHPDRNWSNTRTHDTGSRRSSFNEDESQSSSASSFDDEMPPKPCSYNAAFSKKKGKSNGPLSSSGHVRRVRKTRKEQQLTQYGNWKTQQFTGDAPRSPTNMANDPKKNDDAPIIGPGFRDPKKTIAKIGTVKEQNIVWQKKKEDSASSSAPTEPFVSVTILPKTIKGSSSVPGRSHVRSSNDFLKASKNRRELQQEWEEKNQMGA